jgi:hypothetical protein
MKAQKGEAVKDAVFGASHGWFDKFKRSHLHNIKVQEKAAAADTVAAESFPEHLVKIIDNSGYTKDEIFIVDETGLLWKKPPSRTFIAKEKKTMSGFKPVKDKLTLLLGANGSGTLKLRPKLICHLENTTALKNYVKNTLPSKIEI